MYHGNAFDDDDQVFKLMHLLKYPQSNDNFIVKSTKELNWCCYQSPKRIYNKMASANRHEKNNGKKAPQLWQLTVSEIQGR